MLIERVDIELLIKAAAFAKIIRPERLKTGSKRSWNFYQKPIREISILLSNRNPPTRKYKKIHHTLRQPILVIKANRT